MGGSKGFNRLAGKFGIDLAGYREGVVSRGKDGTPRFDAETRNAILVEEVMYGFGHVGGNHTLSASSPLFDMNDGVIVVEAKAAYQSGGRLFEMLPYPLGNDFAFMSDGQKQAELFARLAMAYLGDPQMIKEVMPNAYKVYEQLFKLSIDPVTGSAWSSPYFWRDTDSSRSGKIRGQHGSAPVSDKSRGRDRGAGRGAGLDGARERIVRALAASRSGAVVTFENLETRIPARKKAGFSFSGDSEWIANCTSGGSTPVGMSRYVNRQRYGELIYGGE